MKPLTLVLVAMVLAATALAASAGGLLWHLGGLVCGLGISLLVAHRRREAEEEAAWGSMAADNFP